MHYDNGFVVSTGPKELKWCLTHNFMATECLDGEVDNDGKRVTFNSTSIGNATEVLGTKRVLEISPDGKKMTETFFMKTESVADLTEHLHTEYQKKP